MKLDYTGNIGYRKGFFGGYVLQVEYRYLYSESSYNLNDEETRTAWRDATEEDLRELQLPASFKVK